MSSAYAVRSFPAISTNNSVTLDLDADEVASDGYVGINFLDQDFASEFSLFVQPAVGANNEDYLIDDGSGPTPIDTKIVANGTPVHLDLVLVDADTHTYSVSLTQGGNSFTLTDGSLSINPSDPSDEINTVYFADYSSGTPFLLNNLTVVPFPTAAAAGLPLLGLLAVLKLKRH